MSAKLTLITDQITDARVRDNFRNLSQYLGDNPFLHGDFKFYTITVKITDATTGFQFQHDLGYTPSDVLVTSVKGSGTVTWNYDKFTAQVLDLTVTGGSVGSTVTIRCLAGNLS